MPRLLLPILFTFALLARAEDVPKLEKDVVYGTTGDVELKLDLARPSGDGPFPCLVFIHGGGWSFGTKTGYDGAIRDFAKHGYVAATLEYRFCPKYKFPAQVEDCKCAVRYLRAHAKELHINADKFGALGDSAGGHLALMLGLMNKEDGCEGDGGCPEQSSKVQAVVNFYGPGDFDAATKFDDAVSEIAAKTLIHNFLGTTDPTNPIVKQASPQTYLKKSQPPVLTFHGSKDPLVPLSVSKTLHEKLKKAGVEEKLEVLEGKGHGWGGEDKTRTMKEALEFFDAHLKK